MPAQPPRAPGKDSPSPLPYVPYAARMGLLRALALPFHVATRGEHCCSTCPQLQRRGRMGECRPLAAPLGREWVPALRREAFVRASACLAADRTP